METVRENSDSPQTFLLFFFQLNTPNFFRPVFNMAHPARRSNDGIDIRISSHSTQDCINTCRTVEDRCQIHCSGRKGTKEVCLPTKHAVFEPFPTLPVELRTMIWKETVERRNFHVRFFDEPPKRKLVFLCRTISQETLETLERNEADPIITPYQTYQAIGSLYRVCRESRDMAVRTYGTPSKVVPARIDPGRDSVLLSYTALTWYKEVLPYYRGHSQLHPLAVGEWDPNFRTDTGIRVGDAEWITHLASSLRRCTIDMTQEAIDYVLEALVRNLPALRHLRIELRCGQDCHYRTTDSQPHACGQSAERVANLCRDGKDLEPWKRLRSLEIVKFEGFY